MKKLIFYAALIATFLLVKCSDDDDDNNPGPGDVEAPTVRDLLIDDITNNADASDIEVSFSPALDETKILEYRIYVVRGESIASFNLESAEALGQDRYTAVEKNGLRKKLTLNASALDSDGNAIEEESEYAVYVISVADGTNATISGLSSPSNSIELAQTTIKITYIGNDGVYISDGTNAVIIDALTSGLTGWRPAAAGIQSEIERGSGDFRNVKIAMVTHNHGDHFSPSSINRFLANNSQATLIAPSQALNGINNSAQVSDLNPPRGTSDEDTIDGIRVRVLSLRHFDMFGNNFSGVENFGYLVEIGGKRILHLGDVDFSVNNFSPFNLTNENIDAVLIPTFNTLISASNKSLIDSQIGAKKIICLHLQSTTTVDQVKGAFPNSIVFSTSEQFTRL